MLRWLATLPLIVSTLVLAGPFGCPISHVDTCEAQMRTMCEFQFRCCDVEERLTGTFASFPYVSSEGECIDRVSGYCKLLTAANDDAVAAGRLKFNSDKAKECVSALEEARDSCDLQALTDASSSTADDPGPCAEISEGLVDEGDACASTAECAGEGSSCEIQNEDPDINEELGTRDGECVGPGGVGDDCESRACRNGLTCTYDGAASTYTCTELPGLGEPCPAYQCAEGLGCGYDSTAGENRCQTPGGPGDDCAATGLCAVPLVCTYDQVTYQQTCQSPPSIGEPCPLSQCDVGAFCDTTAGTPGTCEAQVERGGECDPNLYGQCGGEDAYCDQQASPPVCADYGVTEQVDPDQCNGL